ncbi:MAG: nucleotide sugar dehydrogenase [Caldisericia bacterium]
MTVSVFGLGAVGLPLSLILSIKNLKVYGVDIDENRVLNIKKGKSGIYEYLDEKSIDEIILDEIKKGSFIPTTDYEYALKNSNVIIITVPLPLYKNKKVNYKYLIKGAENIGKNLKKGDLVILRSTVPIGTTREILLKILEEKSSLKVEEDFYLSYVPERMAEGKAFEELINMTTVISGVGEKSIEKTYDFFKKYFNGEYHIASSIEVAEASKIIENLQRDLNIAMINSLSLILIEKGLIPAEIVEVAKTHKRVKNLLSPGLGVGGHCLPYAYYYLKESFSNNKKNLKLFEIGRELNDDMPKKVLDLILKKLVNKGKNPKECKLSILGLAMKDFSKDIRESPSIKFLNLAKNIFKEVKAFDPNVELKIDGKLESLKDLLKDSDIVVIPIIQNYYKNLKLSEVKDLVKQECIIVDFKNLFSKEDLEKEKIDYIKF